MTLEEAPEHTSLVAMLQKTGDHTDNMPASHGKLAGDSGFFFKAGQHLISWARFSWMLNLQYR